MDGFRFKSGLLALLTYLFAGGWCAGSYWTQCERPDGTIHVETLFTSCCDEDGDESHEVALGAVHADVSSASGECGCIDSPMTGQFAEQVKDRWKAGPAGELAMAIPVAATVLHSTPALAAPSLTPGLGHSASESVETVVLRC